MHNYNFSEFSMKSNYNWPQLIGCPSASSRVNVMANNLRQLNAHFLVSVSCVLECVCMCEWLLHLLLHFSHHFRLGKIYVLEYVRLATVSIAASGLKCATQFSENIKFPHSHPPHTHIQYTHIQYTFAFCWT